MGLADKACQSLPKGSPPLDKQQAAELHKAISDWALNEAEQTLTREFKFKNFYQTIEFVNAVAWIANQQDHHPDLEVSYNRCQITFTTHSVGGLSENDFICAARVDALFD
ncbi:4a-hydroxytetrahydrobiopterin dehydratase [Thiohalophilus thiocyanatoxydans]|uniref:Putative pterin-4-alpha-carbinolamine dehydratase n=1 Tax=Thiohalophilus thiocyanatoxydans TaxID=381308 RepID=A0A4R8IHC6_9GAMM|nr:4a-hydroxytetrahydrobiopterin dehydratase [Thiohalophilus thiocyanatoxydans]TDY00002.1 4a-hydroxytetrahydrobiopterin dehydratase [Thiohalophilus thiocyanatoxydans]